MVVIRVQTPEGQIRANLEGTATVKDLFREISGLLSLSLKDVADSLYFDVKYTNLVYSKNIHSADPLSKHSSLQHGTLLYLKMERDLGSDSDSDSDISPETLFRNVMSLKDLPRPPMKGKHCTHDSTMRCTRCYTEWEDAFLKYIGKTREDLQMNEHIKASEEDAANAAAAAFDPWSTSPDTKSGTHSPRKGLQSYQSVNNIQHLKDNVTKFQLNIERQKKALVSCLSVSETQMMEVRKLVEESMYNRNFYGIMYGRYEYLSESNRLEANVFIEWIYLPPQECIAGTVVVKSDPCSKAKNKAAEKIANAFGLINLGHTFTHFNDRGFILSGAEIGSLAVRTAKLEARGIEHAKFMTNLRGCIDKARKELVLDAFAASRQLVNLARNNILIENRVEDPGNFVRFSEKQIFELKASELVDAVCFLVPVAVTTHKDIVTAMKTKICSSDFPSLGSLCPPTLHDVSNYISTHKSCKLREVYADCNYLVYLTDIITIEEVIVLIELIKKDAPDESFAEFDKLIKKTVSVSFQ
ncbi:Hypothetical protein GSB_94658 [Giardia duodenalis]|uniref:Nuclear pore localisation protein Npl4 ubiquitin-like domain-containing protein n=2 Tax=Giardia intestinalis TaxID=5741 RepID=C6M095_GIAIB|nr:Hypothetical protein GL50581_4483 [Giardia intestinalis ATCC 50581]ESU44664.1 Hypothetical protein GSB_94658 [Giardia intestinalis]